jgi:hypothetical protein
VEDFGRTSSAITSHNHKGWSNGKVIREYHSNSSKLEANTSRILGKGFSFIEPKVDLRYNLPF